MNKELIEKMSVVESPDFDHLYRQIELRIARKKVVRRTAVAAAVMIFVAMILIPRSHGTLQDESLVYTDDPLEFAEYDPLAPLFEEPVQ